jgi:hypothetical protein
VIDIDSPELEPRRLKYLLDGPLYHLLVSVDLSEINSTEILQMNPKLASMFAFSAPLAVR